MKIAAMEPKTDATEMGHSRIVSRDEWLVARKDMVKRERDSARPFGASQPWQPRRTRRSSMTRELVLSWCVLGLSAAMPLAAADPETQATVEGVRAVENHWARAFVTGDAAYLRSLLTDDYVSVNQSGRARPKSEIIALALKIANGPTPSKPTESTSTIVVRGNAAISTDIGKTDASVDVFYYEGGRWHAWYSQHSPVKPPAAG